MRIIISVEDGEEKQMLYTRTYREYEVVSSRLKKIINELKERYLPIEESFFIADEKYNKEVSLYTDKIYNLINEKDLLSSNNNFDKQSKRDIEFIKESIEYQVDSEITTKEKYDNAWTERMGYQESHITMPLITITYKDTGKIICIEGK